MLQENKAIRPIAIYLPQFHPIPENDAWWGKGFTEWTNVVKAKPLFKGHHQPHLPADLGFYDLRVAEVREQQAQMAKDHGIYGFCYYHYWFNGRRILERPFQEVFESGEPDFPFMLCWANENWTRRWDGADQEILLEQKYSEEDDREHIRSLIPYFLDKRYIRIKDKPVIAIYRSTLLPNPRRTTNIWREEAQKQGLELYICRFENYTNVGSSFLTEGGFDAAVEFQPSGDNFNDYSRFKTKKYKKDILKRIGNKLEDSLLRVFNPKKYQQQLQLKWNVYDYNEYVDFLRSKSLADYKRFPGITPGWDNSARKKKDYFIFKNANPEKYREWLEDILSKYEPFSPEENLLFINAWNEWAEGNHLEPCKKWGLSYLENTREALNGRAKS